MPLMKPTMLLARFRFEEGAVAAVMKDDENAHQQQAGEHGDAPVSASRKRPDSRYIAYHNRA
jgi:hypothetical protein